MRTSHNRARVIALGALLVGSTIAFADGTRFSDFTPLSSSAGPTLDETAPITFGNPLFRQESIADRQFQVASLKPNGNGSLFTGDDDAAWDMNALNETGHDKGRYLFTVFEQNASGVQRTDLATGVTDTIWQSWAGFPATRFDPSFWTPWGTFITGEENWGDCGAPDYACGRLFELRNPTTAPGIFVPVSQFSNEGADFSHQNAVPRVSHEGIQFDRDGNMYFIDELSSGNLYKYAPAATLSHVMNGQADYFAAGQTFVLRVGDGTTPGATGPFTWVPLTTPLGSPLPGGVTIVSHGVPSVDGRATADVPAFKGTDYNRPEDMQIQSVGGREYLYMNATGTHQTFRVDLTNRIISVFADRTTIDLATGLPVGSALANQDNLAVDRDGNIYIVEDRNGGVDDDIWFANDLNKDGDLLDPGEGIGRWASNGTPGSEFTGLYFDPFNKRRAWVNIQHPSSGVSRTIEITIPGGGDQD